MTTIPVCSRYIPDALAAIAAVMATAIVGNY